MKFINLLPGIKQRIQQILRHDSSFRSSAVEIQQRSIEYLILIEVYNPTVLPAVLYVMSPYPEKQSPSLVRLKQKKPSMDADADGKATTAHGHEPHAADQQKTMKTLLI